MNLPPSPFLSLLLIFVLSLFLSLRYANRRTRITPGELGHSQIWARTFERSRIRGTEGAFRRGADRTSCSLNTRNEEEIPYSLARGSRQVKPAERRVCKCLRGFRGERSECARVCMNQRRSCEIRRANVVWSSETPFHSRELEKTRKLRMYDEIAMEEGTRRSTEDHSVISALVSAISPLMTLERILATFISLRSDI